METADNYRVETADNYRNPDERSAGHGCDPLTSVSGNPCRSADSPCFEARLQCRASVPGVECYLVPRQLSSDGAERCGIHLQKEMIPRDCFDCVGSSAILRKLNNTVGENLWISAVHRNLSTSGKDHNSRKHRGVAPRWLIQIWPHPANCGFGSPADKAAVSEERLPRQSQPSFFCFTSD